MCKILGFPFGRRALPRLDARKKRAREKPPRASRTGQDQAIPTYRSCPTPPCRWRSPDRHRDRILLQTPQKNARGKNPRAPAEQVKIRRSPPTDFYRETQGEGLSLAMSRTTAARAGDRPPRYGALTASRRDRSRRCCFYFACFTSPNVFNARCAGETGPRNRRVINVSRLPPNETSSI